MLSIEFNIDKSIIINKSIEKIYKIVSDFNTWKSWSPWLCQEPDCPVDITESPGEIGHGQKWNGKRIGSGKMQIIGMTPNEHIDYELFFLKPWKSHSKVSFYFEQANDGVQVRWTMDGTLPFFLFYMKKMMSAWVGSDYERGLSMLKERAETGEVNSRVEVNEISVQRGFTYVGRRKACSIEGVGPAMEESLEQMGKAKIKNGFPDPDFVFSFYHKYDLVSRQCEYTSGFGYYSNPYLPVAKELENGSVKEHKALNVNHTGPYRHLGNAWSTIMGAQRSEKLKLNKKISMYEIYETIPGSVEENKIQTSIYLPVQ